MAKPIYPISHFPTPVQEPRYVIIPNQTGRDAGPQLRAEAHHLPFPISRLTERSVVRELWIRSWYAVPRLEKFSGLQVEVCAHAHASMSKIFLFRVLTFEVNHLMYMGDKQKEKR